MATTSTPPDAVPPPRAWPPRPLYVVLVAVVLIFAGLTTFWWATGTGPFATIQTSTWAYSMTQVSSLHARGLDGRDVTVCIVDTGVDLTHPDLKGVALVAWRDYVNQEQQPYDDQGHGTSMAGIVFGRGRIHGVAPAAKLIAVKAIASTGSGADSAVSSAVRFCIDPDGDQDLADGADVISLSLGGGSHPILGDNSLTKDAVNVAMDAGVIVVAAAGNDGQRDDGDVESPASVDRVIAVGAVDRAGVIAPFSSRGSPTGGLPPLTREDPGKKPEVVAPGVEIATLLNGGRYAYVSGTSPAAALMSGFVALLLQAHASYQHDSYQYDPARLLQFKTAIMDGAAPVSGQQEPHDARYGYGLAKGVATSDLL